MEHPQQRKLSEEALRDSEQRYASIIAATNEGVFDWDLLGSATHASDQWLDLYGRTTPSVEAWRSTIQPEDLARLDHSFQDYLADKAPISQCDYRVRNAHGIEKWLRGRALAVRDPEGKPVRVYPAVADITERKRTEAEREKLEAQLAQAQKMESVGRLAGGWRMISTTCSKPSSATPRLRCRTCRRRAPCASAWRRSSNPPADLTRQLLAFARKQTIAPKVLDLNDTVAGMLKMLRRLIG
jgi:two-component system, cell cycle sensor histidine kinase and response regulator CckA